MNAREIFWAIVEGLLKDSIKNIAMAVAAIVGTVVAGIILYCIGCLMGSEGSLWPLCIGLATIIAVVVTVVVVVVVLITTFPYILIIILFLLLWGVVLMGFFMPKTLILISGVLLAAVLYCWLADRFN